MNDYYIIDENSTEYPQKLKEINDRPKKLYCKGDLSLLNTRCIAMVGSRKYTMYGKYTAEMIGRKMAEAGIPVVSGLAAGIDSFSHIGVLDGDGKPIAVLGTGINVT